MAPHLSQTTMRDLTMPKLITLELLFVAAAFFSGWLAAKPVAAVNSTAAATSTPLRCICPELSVTGPEGRASSGTPITFEAAGTGTGKRSYKWTISTGEIKSGQGTSKIVVEADNAPFEIEIKATVEVIQTAPDCTCTLIASQTALIGQPPPQARNFGDLRGRVINSKRKPVAGANVTLYPDTTLPTLTDANGYYLFKGVPALDEAYRITVSLGERKVVFNVKVLAFQEKRIRDIKLP